MEACFYRAFFLPSILTSWMGSCVNQRRKYLIFHITSKIHAYFLTNNSKESQKSLAISVFILLLVKPLVSVRIFAQKKYKLRSTVWLKNKTKIKTPPKNKQQQQLQKTQTKNIPKPYTSKSVNQHGLKGCYRIRYYLVGLEGQDSNPLQTELLDFIFPTTTVTWHDQGCTQSSRLFKLLPEEKSRLLPVL